MSVKRSRIVRSPSLGDVCTFDQARPVESPFPQREKRATVLHSVNILKPPVSKPDQPRRKILTLGSPVHESVALSLERDFGSQVIGSFLERCHGCKKKIRETDEVFMYSYLCAFCSPECREKQIELDGEFEQDSDESERNEAKIEGILRGGSSQIGCSS